MIRPADNEQNSTAFLARHKKIVEKSLFIIVSMILTLAAFFLAAPVALLGGMLLCTLAPKIAVCSDHSLGLITFGVFALITCAITATISLHKLAKISWLVSLELSLIGGAMLQLAISIPTTIMRENTPSSPALELALTLIVSIFLIAIVFVLEKLKKWSPLVAIPLFIIVLFGGQILDQPLQNAHQAYEVENNFQEAQNLPFKVYSPSYVPVGYQLVDIVTTPAAGNLPTSFGLHYSTGSKENSYQSAVEQIDIDEEARDGELNAPDKCMQVGMAPDSAPCKILGKTKQGTIYNRFLNDDPDYYDVYTEINGTSLRLIAKKEVPVEGILRILESMQPRIDRP